MISERIRTAEASTETPNIGSFIDGGLDSSMPGSILVTDPATGQELARIGDAGDAGVSRAVEVGSRAFAGWRSIPARDRGVLVSALADRIVEHADDLARLDSLDTGNPLTAMRADVAKGARLLRDAAGLAMEMKGLTYPLPGLHFTQREPWGVVGRMITFNHPVMFACARLGSALIAGNCVVMKPSELAPLGTLAIAELTKGILPDGVVSVVVGGAATGSALVRHPDVLRLSFTGSTATALRIQASAAESGRVKTLSFELGGKNPIVVFPDVDLEEAAAAIVRGMNYTRVQGQSCGSTSRLIVHSSIADEILERVAAASTRIRIGSPLDPETEMGSMISPAARDRCLTVLERGIASGSRVRAGGRIPDRPDLAGGSFLEPTVVDRVSPDSELAREEIFGPVLVAMPFETEEEAVALANDGRYGLTAAIWTQDIDRALRLAGAIEAGYLWINDVETRFPAIPFGGWKDSGVGAEHGLEEILSFTRTKAVNVRVR